MPTAILDLDLDQLPPEVTGLDAYDRALALIRFRGRPVAKTVFRVSNGTITGDALRQEIIDAAGELPWECWLQDFLGLNAPTTAPRPATIAICTRERTRDLAQCLNSLEKLRDADVEILVVDNAPKTQKTRELVTQFFPHVRYLCEPAQGLDRARNRALAEATHEIVAFIDDDAVADQGWLKTLATNFADPLVMCVTGLTMPLELETKAQEWFEAHCPFGKGFRRKIFKGDAHDPLRSGEIGAGVNMAVRRQTILELGGFDPALDAGTPTHSGGDHELFSRILASGYSIVYDPGALSWHRHRRTWEELQRAVYGYGVGVYALLTRTIMVEREWAALKIPWGWLRHDQIPKLIGALRHSAEVEPLDLLIAELKGCAAGPFAYLRSRKLAIEGEQT